jgi:ATP-dependent Zn protease
MEEAVEKVVAGPERKSRRLNEEEKRRTDQKERYPVSKEQTALKADAE